MPSPNLLFRNRFAFVVLLVAVYLSTRAEKVLDLICSRFIWQHYLSNSICEEFPTADDAMLMPFASIGAANKKLHRPRIVRHSMYSLLSFFALVKLAF